MGFGKANIWDLDNNAPDLGLGGWWWGKGMGVVSPSLNVHFGCSGYLFPSVKIQYFVVGNEYTTQYNRCTVPSSHRS